MTQSQTLIEAPQPAESLPTAVPKNDFDLPEFPELADVKEEDTAVITSRAFRQLRTIKKSYASPAAPLPESNTKATDPALKIHHPKVWGKIEKSSLWKVVSTVLMVCVIILMVLMMKLIRG